jgi:hypothetical protein
MATKVSITLKDNEGKEEIIKKSFFGSEHLNRYFDFATGGSVLRMKFFSKKMG